MTPSQELPKTMEKEMFTSGFTRVAKLQLESSNQNGFMVEGHHMKNYIKGLQN